MDIFSPDHIGVLIDKGWDLVVQFVPRLVSATLILVAADFVARRAARGISALVSRGSHIDGTLRFVLAEVVRYAVIILAFVVALQQLGVQAASLLAVLGAAGLAIGLALQGTLSNIAAGVMLLWLRPFRLGDYIEVNNVPGLAGTVRQIGLFSCQLEAFDGLFLFVPNAGLWNVPLRNYTRNAARLLSFTITIPPNIPVATARKALLELARNNHWVAKDPVPIVFVDRVGPDGVVLNFRLWSAPSDMGELQRTLLEACQEVLAGFTEDRKSVLISRIVPPDTDPSRLMPQTARPFRSP